MTAPRGRQHPDGTGLSARRAAWHTYLALRTDVLPAIASEPLDSHTVTAAMADLANRIRRHAPHWGLRGSHLVLITDAAMRRRAATDHDALALLLHLTARWLFDLSRTRPRRF